MNGTYRMSAGTAAYLVGFSLVWLGGFIWLALQIPFGELWYGIVAAVLVGLSIGGIPALVNASIPHTVTLIDEGEYVFRSVLRERRVRVEEITAIVWDDGEIRIRHVGGTVRILADPAFKHFLLRILELSPAIPVDEAVRQSLIADD